MPSRRINLPRPKCLSFQQNASKTRKGSQQLPCKTLAILLSGLNYKKDNGYLYGIIGVSGVVHPQTQLNDALIESCAARDEIGGPMSCFVQTHPTAAAGYRCIASLCKNGPPQT